MIDVSTWCALITKGVSVWGSFYVLAVRTSKKVVHMAGLLLFFLADVIDTGQLVAIKGHKTAIESDSVSLQPQSSYWHRNFWSRDQNDVQDRKDPRLILNDLNSIGIACSKVLFLYSKGILVRVHKPKKSNFAISSSRYCSMLIVSKYFCSYLENEFSLTSLRINVFLLFA